MIDRRAKTVNDRGETQTAAQLWLIYPRSRKENIIEQTLRRISDGAYATIEAVDIDDSQPDELLGRAAKLFSSSLSHHNRNAKSHWGFRGSYVYGRANAIATTCGIPVGERFRPARALILLASHFRLSSYIEGFRRALESGFSTARIDLISAGHLLARWSFEVEPRLSLLLARALTTAPHEEVVSGVDTYAYAYPPFTALFEAALAPHAPPRKRVEVAAHLARLVPREIELVRTKQAQASTVADSLVRGARELAVIPALGADRHEVFVDDRGRTSRLEAALVELAIGLELGLLTPHELQTYRPILEFAATQLKVGV